MCVIGIFFSLKKSLHNPTYVIAIAVIRNKQKHVCQKMKMGEDNTNLNSKSINSNVFDLFKPLNSDDSNVNIDGSVKLLKYFATNDVSSSFINILTIPHTAKSNHIFDRIPSNNAVTL